MPSSVHPGPVSAWRVRASGDYGLLDISWWIGAQMKFSSNQLPLALQTQGVHNEPKVGIQIRGEERNDDATFFKSREISGLKKLMCLPCNNPAYTAPYPLGSCLRADRQRGYFRLKISVKSRFLRQKPAGAHYPELDAEALQLCWKIWICAFKIMSSCPANAAKLQRASCSAVGRTDNNGQEWQWSWDYGVLGYARLVV